MKQEPGRQICLHAVERLWHDSAMEALKSIARNGNDTVKMVFCIFEDEG